MMTLVSLLCDQARKRPDFNVLTFVAEDRPDETLSFGELERRARAIAARLAKTTRRGDRVLLLYPSSLEFVAAFFGCLYAGLIPVHGPYPTRPLARVLPRLLLIAADAGATAAVFPAEAGPIMTELCSMSEELQRLTLLDTSTVSGAAADDFSPADVKPSDIAFLQYTSGSTSSPRGVMVTHANVLANLEYAGQPPDTRIVSWLPLFHDFGLVYGVLQPIYSAIPGVLMAPTQFLRRPLSWLETIQRFRSTHSPAPNFAFDLCLRAVPPEARAGLDLSSWKVAINAAEPVRASTLRRFLDSYASSGVRPDLFLPAYGLAEYTLIVSVHPEGDLPTFSQVRNQERVGCGRFGRGTRVVIVDPETRHELAQGEEGEIWVSGPSRAAGYWNRPEDSEATFAAFTDIGEGPFLRTGDLGIVRGDELFVTGRRKDLLILFGQNYYPQDIELSVEQSHPAIVGTGVAAFAIDSDDGEAVAVAAEIDKRSRSPEECAFIASAIRSRVSADHALPLASVVLIEPGSLPKTTSGKVRRSACRSLLAEGGLKAVYRTDSETPAAPRDVPSDSVGAKLIHLLGRLLRNRREHIRPEQTLGELGLDSVSAVELLTEISNRWSVQLDPGKLFTLSVSDIEQRIEAHTQAPAKAAAPAYSYIAETNPETAQRRPITTPPVSMVATRDGLDFSLFYFADAVEGGGGYDLLLDSARAADRLGFDAIWLPERHFHPFGGICPNPSILAAAVSQQTTRIRIRSGSVILPLHNPVRVAEEWALIDQLSHGRVDLAFGTGWNPNDFVLAPEAFENRRDLTFEGIELIRRLWRGEAIEGKNGKGKATTFRTFPVPAQPELDVWLTCTRGVEGFIEAGAAGYNVLTALLFQTMEELEQKLRLYRMARERHGHDPNGGHVTLMLHTFIGKNQDDVREKVHDPFIRYLESSVSLWQQGSTDLARLDATERAAALEYAFERYYQQSALFGTPESCAPMLERLNGIGVQEVACLIDFGVEAGSALAGLRYLDELRHRRGRAKEVAA